MSYCDWDKVSNICKKYHDAEWGIPVFDDRMQFEYLMMEVMQCGLSWDIVINKREIFRTCFDNFVPEIIAKYDEKNIIKIMNHQGMIKSKRKIEAVINNAKCFLKIQEKFGSFCNYIWSYTDNITKDIFRPKTVYPISSVKI